MRRGGSVSLTALGIVLCGLVTSLLSPRPARADTDPSDPEIVYCLSSAHRAELHDAAVALTLTVPADLTELNAWRTRDPNGFRRACDALYQARAPEVVDNAADHDLGFVLTTILPFLTATFGALLAFAAAAWRDGVARGRSAGVALRSAFEAFRTAAEVYLASWTAGRSDADLRARRRELVARLTETRAAHPRWTAVHTLLERLDSGDLGQPLSTGWTSDTQQTKERRICLDRALNELQDEVFSIADTLARPLRVPAERKPPSGTTGHVG